MSDLQEIKKVTDALFDLLSPLTPEDRQRALASTLTLFGEAAPASVKATAPNPDRRDGNGGDAEKEISGAFTRKVEIWLKQNDIDLAALEHIFHFEDGKAIFIGNEVPGTSAKTKVANIYAVTGLTSFLTTGEPKFADAAAREMCNHFSVLDTTNHGKSVKSAGSNLMGNKDTGWTLTAPGLKAAAAIVKEMTKGKER